MADERDKTQGLRNQRGITTRLGDLAATAMGHAGELIERSIPFAVQTQWLPAGRYIKDDNLMARLGIEPSDNIRQRALQIAVTAALVEQFFHLAPHSMLGGSIGRAVRRVHEISRIDDNDPQRVPDDISDVILDKTLDMHSEDIGIRTVIGAILPNFRDFGRSYTAIITKRHHDRLNNRPDTSVDALKQLVATTNVFAPTPPQS